MRARWVVAVSVLTGACGEHRPAPRISPPAVDRDRDRGELDVPSPVPPDETRDYTLWLGGARIGTATERETYTATGMTLRREEALRFLRGDAPVVMTTTIEIQADRQLVAQRVLWTEHGRSTRESEAVRIGGRWQIDGIPSSLSPTAVPAELVPLVVRRDGAFAGDVFLPARGFIGGHGRVDQISGGNDTPGRQIARLELAGGAVAEATIDVERDGTASRVVDGDGVIAMRTSATAAAAPFTAVDLVAATAVPIAGARVAGPTRLELRGDLAMPPVPGQAARPLATGLELTLAANLPGDLPPGADGPDRSGEIRSLVATVQRRIAPDLGASPTSAHDADRARAGDCTTYALAYAALAIRDNIPTRIVTGLKIDGTRLVRHRWAVSWTGRSWIAVDAAFGAAPAGGDLIGLAVHDADDAGLVTGEAALHDVTAATWR